MQQQRSFRSCLVIVLCGWLFSQTALASAQSSIVDTAFVKSAAERGAILWDVRGWPGYRKGHLPGAVGIGPVGSVLRNDYDEDYIPLPRMEAILGEAGIDPAKEIVVYGDKASPSTYFALITLQYLGAKQAYAYHGGIDDWADAGLPISTEYRPLPPVKLKLEPNPALLASTREVLERVKQGEGDTQIVDVRSPGEYTGEDIRALRGGHIPGAVNIPYEQNWKDPETRMKLAKKQVKTTEGLDLKSPDELKALYRELDPNKETIVYCQSGARAAVTTSVLREMGFKDVKIYDSSWLGYGSRLDAPAADETFLNVGALLSRISYLETRIEGLEEELAGLRKAMAR
jgi:thiosulfate/3-mercaptopyruvate sulfurtransferase